jgi:hypothetical protein
MHLKTWAVTFVTATLALVGVAVVASAPAHAGQVGVTISITGAGTVLVAEGTPADGVSGTCNATANRTNPGATITCARIRSEAPFEAWLWLRPVPYFDASGTWSMESDGWQGCDQTRRNEGVMECGVHSGAFSSDERAPHITFVDRAAPVVSPITATVSAATDRTATFDFRANEPGSTYCTFDDGTAWVLCSPPVSHTYATDGPHRFSVQAHDLSGNSSSVVSTLTTLVDTVLEEGPPAETNERTATFTFSSGGATSYRCRLDSGDLLDCGTGQRTTWSAPNLAEGRHTLEVWGRAGSVGDPTAATHTWTVDTTAPETEITRASIVAGTAHFDVSSPGADHLTCRLTRDGRAGAWERCGDAPYFDGLDPASYVVEIAGTDRAGNTDATPATHTWTVAPQDSTAPNTVLTKAPAQGSWLLANRTTVRYAADEAVASWRCTLDGTARRCEGGSTELSNLRAGTHVLKVAAVDAAGNVDRTPATRTWTVPLTSAALKHGRGWKQQRASAAYASAWATTKRRGATMTTTVRGARTIVLVATTGRHQGTVKVYAGRRLLRTVNLAARTTHSRRVLRVATLAKPYSGTLRIVSGSSKQVRVEGLGVR